MTLTAKNIIGLRVETRSGDELGVVKNFSVTQGDLKILSFEVKPSGGIKKLVEKSLDISASAVISISKEKIIVEDLATREPAEDKLSVAPQALPAV